MVLLLPVYLFIYVFVCVCVRESVCVSCACRFPWTPEGIRFLGLELEVTVSWHVGLRPKHRFSAKAARTLKSHVNSCAAQQQSFRQKLSKPLSFLLVGFAFLRQALIVYIAMAVLELTV